MKKILATLLFVIASVLIVNAQKIEKDYFDTFTGKRAMYTKLEKINWGYNNKRIGGKMQIRFVLNEDFQYMVLHWYCKNSLVQVEAGAQIQFKFDNGHMLTLKNEKLVSAMKGGTKISRSDVGVVLNCIGDVPKFATAMVTTIRIHTTEGYFDFDITEKDAQKIHKLYLLFNKQIGTGGFLN